MDNLALKNKIKDIIMYLSLTENYDEIYNFLRDLLSEKEIIELSRRFKVAELLQQKIPYTIIEANTKMSSTTISRISKYLKWDNKGYLNALLKLKAITNKHFEAHWS